MRALLMRLATAGMILALLGGCVPLPPAPPPEERSPASAVTGTSAPTSEATPAAGGIPTHPPSARTKIPAVDRVIEAALSGDSAALRGLMRFITTPCTTAEGLGGPPKCAAGEADGTAVEVFPVGGPEGTFVRAAEADGLLPLKVAGLYGVYRVPADAYREEYWPAGEYGVVFARTDGSFVVVLVSREGIVRLDYPDPETVDRLMQSPGSRALPPVG